MVGGEARACGARRRLVVDHGAHVVIGQSSSTFETSWEVRKPSKKCRNGTRALERRGLGDQGEVHGLLDVVGGEQAKPVCAAGHDVGVVAEDGERLGGK